MGMGRERGREPPLCLGGKSHAQAPRQLGQRAVGACLLCDVCNWVRQRCVLVECGQPGQTAVRACLLCDVGDWVRQRCVRACLLCAVLGRLAYFALCGALSPVQLPVCVCLRHVTRAFRQQ